MHNEQRYQGGFNHGDRQTYDRVPSYHRASDSLAGPLAPAVMDRFAACVALDIALFDAFLAMSPAEHQHRQRNRAQRAHSKQRPADRLSSLARKKVGQQK